MASRYMSASKYEIKQFSDGNMKTLKLLFVVLLVGAAFLLGLNYHSFDDSSIKKETLKFVQKYCNDIKESTTPGQVLASILLQLRMIQGLVLYKGICINLWFDIANHEIKKKTYHYSRFLSISVWLVTDLMSSANPGLLSIPFPVVLPDQ